jgi:hypothetical protein
MGCPICGSREYKQGPAETQGGLKGNRRTCARCGREYHAPKREYLSAIAAYLIGLILLFFLVADWFYHPRDFPVTLTWEGRLAILALAPASLAVGTILMFGKPWR